jgi:nickel-dependent lactate racemase
LQEAVGVGKKKVREESEEKVMIENENLKQSNLTVTITQHRYEQLLDIETRVDVVVERITREKCMGMEEILRTLGTELALQGAEEMKEEKRKESM